MALPALKRSRLRGWFDADPVYKPISERRRPKLEAMWAREREAAERQAMIEGGVEPPETSVSKKRRKKPKPSEFVTQPQVTAPRITPTGLTMPKVKLPKMKSRSLKTPKIKIP
jgi:hypothetical protein